MSTSTPLDPRIEEVLQDIARHPRSKLFVGDVRKLVHGLGSARVQVSASQAGLSSAERHLLGMYREEVAKLLLDEAREQILADPNSRAVDPCPRMYAEERTTRLQHLRSDLPEGGPRETVPLPTVMRALQSLRNGPAGSEELLLHAIRVCDTSSARILLAHELLRQGRTRAAYAEAVRVTAVRPRARVLVSAMEVAGASLDAEDAYEDALSFFRAAVEMSEKQSFPPEVRLGALASTLYLSLRLGHEVDSLWALRALDALDIQSRDHLQATSRTSSRARQRGPSPSEGELALAKRLLEKSGTVSRVFLNAII